MSKYTDRAAGYFKQGYNCSQSVVAAFAEEFNLDEETALKLSCGFGAGIGRMRNVCGAFSGAVMLTGMTCDPTDKAKAYETVRKLADKFREENGSIICAELLGLKKAETSCVPEQRTSEYYKKRPCVKMVEYAASLVEEFLLNSEND